MKVRKVRARSRAGIGKGFAGGDLESATSQIGESGARGLGDEIAGRVGKRGIGGLVRSGFAVSNLAAGRSISRARILERDLGDRDDHFLAGKGKTERHFGREVRANRVGHLDYPV
jgi:hypothetical protein